MPVKRAKTALYVILFIFIISNKSLSDNLIYSGFSLQGNFSDSSLNYPMFSKFLEDNNTINEKLFQLLNGESNIEFQKSSDNNGKVVSFGLLTENINYSIINNFLKGEFMLYPQVFIYDNDTKNFLSSHSTRLLFRIATEIDPSQNPEDILIKRYKDKLLNNKAEITYKGRCVDEPQIKLTFIQIYKELFNCQHIKDVDRFNLQVRNVDLGKSQYGKFSFTENNDQHLSAMKYKLANLATAAVSSLTYNNRFLVLPHSKEQSIANVQSRFSDTMNITINLPEPDFVLDLKINGSIKKKLAEDEDEAIYMYAIGINFKILEPYSDTLIFDSDFKFAKKKEFAKDLSSMQVIQTEENDYYLYNQLFEELIADFSSNLLVEKLTNVNKKWLKKYSNNSSSYDKSIKMHKNIVNTFF